MWFALYTAVTAFVVAFVLLPVLINVLTKKLLLDVGGRRKIHKGFVPSMGGVSIFLGFAFAVAVWVPVSQLEPYKFLCAAATLVFITGMRDDLTPLSPRGKLVMQLAAGAIVAWGGGEDGIRIANLGGFFGIHQLPLVISYLLTIFVIIVITNAFNLIDGLDGLAGLIGLFAFSLLAGWFFLIADEMNHGFAFALLFIALVGGTLAFLCYNWHPASIFMGDTGSLLLGFMLSVGLVKFLDLNADPNFVSFFKVGAPVSMTAAIGIIPILDTGRIFLLRISQGRSPFSPDKLHIHHLLMRMGLKHSYVALIMGALYLSVVVGIYFLSKLLPDNILVLIIIAMCVGLHFLLKYIVETVFSKHREEHSVARISSIDSALP
ncbi:MAG: undecaprenyl/decaprenyl-phosphate alpha-N-acetylglucosaminyl 1-phosphate transferase [Prevotellaceae bacterium]|jgi:UDP-N-acetylmuramyl pentapeptide phosphotransferase/UDP-N-acetylglucosamine-1-phosphate transferase|nr:undecaprenyl/decaprenyl-phosphate alpha-N-acetylglucosaminyl 1-phosphate transferase [Prevotellaceae bacterium]